MIVYRLGKQQYILDLTGRGAELIGRRWNSHGIPMVYTSHSRALCTVEVAVHMSTGILPIDFEIVTIHIPDDAPITETPLTNLDPDWKSFPYVRSTQLIGNAFILKTEYLVMKVPSAVIPGDFNYLINPRHPDIHLVKIIQREPYSFDQRLFKR